MQKPRRPSQAIRCRETNQNWDVVEFLLGRARNVVTRFVLGARKKADSGLKSCHLQYGVCVQQLVANCMGKFYREICKRCARASLKASEIKRLKTRTCSSANAFGLYILNSKLKPKLKLPPLADSASGKFQ